MFYKLDIIILYSKQNNIWLFGDRNFSPRVQLDI